MQNHAGRTVNNVLSKYISGNISIDMYPLMIFVADIY